MKRVVLWSCLMLVVSGTPATVSLSADGGQTTQEAVSFSRQIRPLLAENCFACHGPDDEHREADMRLDIKESVAAVANGNNVIVPGDSSQSELYVRITSAHEDERMPPAESGRELSRQEIELIRRWIDEGAEWQEHWSFIPPRQPPLPPVRNEAWPRNGIDYFILAQLENEGLQPSRQANEPELIRRVSLDLTGLPPTSGEVRRFLEDGRPDAYERLVERLLCSPRYGERLAMEWMDVARYADTHSYLEDYHRDMWPWRNWVIDAFNTNIPFDQFTIEQLAGDLLPDSTSRQKIATGFNRNHGVTSSGISEEYRVEYVIDRLRTTSTVWLGLTIGCAQCHDHKYDPISQRDFYRLFAFFNTITERGVELRSGNVDPLMAVLPPEAEQQVVAMERRITKLEVALEARAQEIDWVRAEAMLTTIATDVPSVADLIAHYPLDKIEAEHVASTVPDGAAGTIKGQAECVPGQVSSALQLDGREQYVELGDVAGFERFDAFSLGAWISPSPADDNIDARFAGPSVIARIADDEANRGYDLSVRNGRLRVYLAHSRQNSAIEIATATKIRPNDWNHLFVTYDGSSRARGVRIYLNGELQPVEVVEDHLRDSMKTTAPLCLGGQNRKRRFHGLIDDVRIYDRELTAMEVLRLAGSNQLKQNLATPIDRRSPLQQQLLRQYYLAVCDAEYRKLLVQRDDLRSGATQIRHSYPTVMVMKEMPRPRNTYVLRRGRYDQPEEQVEIGIPAVLPALPTGAPPSRLEFARWLMSPSHPLTSRVTVNRFWQMFFGTGIVKTSEDFGTQGEFPSHPELLDWLATQFIDCGWDVRAILKLMVTSSTYRQSSRISRSLLTRDPENRLLARGPRFRLPAELIRDNALTISGLLVERLGGESVRPYQPPSLWKEISNRSYEQDHGENLYRRSLYTYWKRAVPPPNMLALDAPTRETCTVRRQRTNTPLMALVTLNDPTFVEASRALAQRMMTEASETAQEAVQFAFELATARIPGPVEQEVLLSLFRKERRVFRRDEEAARRLLAVGESPQNSKLDPAELAAWTVVAGAILNLDETMTKE